MPCVVPSHQAPALLLKLWRPTWFSGLALVLGSMAPDLEFILRMDNEWVVSHTLAAQVYFTIPLVLVLYSLSVGLVIPWILPYLPAADALRLEALTRARLPRGSEWGTVALSGAVGGLTHIALDGFTHGGRSGWAVAFLPFLRWEVGLGVRAPIHDVLQAVVSIVLAVGAVRLGEDVVAAACAGRSLAPPISPATPESRSRLAGALVIAAAAGVATAHRLHPLAAGFESLELGLYGAVDFVALAVVLAAAWDRLRVAGYRVQVLDGV
jgi:Domain of unknown function (DUF4184)